MKKLLNTFKETTKEELLNTFFFGYLEFKWRRLVRTLFLAYIIPVSIVALYFLVTQERFGEFENFLFVILLILFPLCPLVSYILKPFVVKED